MEISGAQRSPWRVRLIERQGLSRPAFKWPAPNTGASMLHTRTTLNPLLQGIEIQSVEDDDFGNQVPGPHELQGEVNGIPVTIAYVDSCEQICGMDDLPDVKITKAEQIENLRRLAHCWNTHDELLTVVKELEESAAYWSEYDVPLGIVDRLRAAIAKAESRS